jgi:hypothetical protein
MKKSIFVTLLLCFTFITSAFAVTLTIGSDPQGAIPSTVTKTSDAAVKATPGYVHSVLYSYKGVTAGDTIDINDNSAAGGTVLIRFVAPAANGSFFYNPPAPISFPATGIYYDVTISGGAASVTIQYS